MVAAMSAAITPAPPAPFPVVALPDAPPSKRDVVSETVLRYFEAERRADHAEHADAFDRLTAICYRAVQPYFLRDRHGSLTIQKTPQFDSIDGRRTGHHARKEGAAHDVTREWVQCWLLKFLAPYRRKSNEELAALADDGEFRYLGRLCRLRLKEIVCRQLKRESKEDFTGFVSTEVPALNDNGQVEMAPRLATNRQDAPSSLGDVSFEEMLCGAEQARRIVLANADELGTLDLFSGLMACLSVADHVTEPHFAGLVTRTIAGLRGVSVRSARAYKHAFRQRVAQELRAGNRVVASIFRELDQESPRPFAV